jgi:hypothetical protein
MLLPAPLSLTLSPERGEGIDSSGPAPLSLTLSPERGEGIHTARIWDLLLWFSINGTCDRCGHRRRLDDCGMWW